MMVENMIVNMKTIIHDVKIHIFIYFSKDRKYLNTKVMQNLCLHNNV